MIHYKDLGETFEVTSGTVIIADPKTCRKEDKVSLATVPIFHQYIQNVKKGTWKVKYINGPQHKI